MCRLHSSASRFKDESANVEALRWLTLAAEQRGENAAKAQFNVGKFHFIGVGTAKNPLEGIKWFVKAANAGDESAQNELKAMLNQPPSAAWTHMAESAATYDTLLRVAKR